MAEGGAMGTLSMFIGMGGALPERGREIPEDTRKQVFPVSTDRNHTLKVDGEAGGRGLPRGGWRSLNGLLVTATRERRWGGK